MSFNVEDQLVALAVPRGLEVASIKTARREAQVRVDTLAPGFVVSKERASDPALARLLDAPPIWTFGSFRVIKKSVPLDSDGAGAALTALADSVAALGWTGKAYWLDTGPSVRGWAKQFLTRDFGLRNDPSDYELTLRIDGDEKAAIVMLGSSISVRRRFAYRHADVGASINPVLAACLARLLPNDLDGCAIDPTCGSGTLLFERLKYSKESSGVGIDMSPNAKKAFETNLANLELPDKEVQFCLGSSSTAEHWRPCSSVIANLPFGIRTRISPVDLDRLYCDILENAYTHLDPGGRILLTSSYKRGLEVAAASMQTKLRVLSKYRAEMGGLFYQIFVFARF